MKRKLLKRCAAIVLGFGSLMAVMSAQALGNRGSMDPVALFEDADTNHDGVVSREEYIAARAAKFDQLDRNHDGFLTDADFPRMGKLGGDRAEKLHDMLQKMDSDHDGKVSRDEFKNGGIAIFDLVDANHDGVVDKAELQHASERLKDLRKN
jgi:Ca2+-binding EF-hand superfamily protein